jgi:hypothetical protein
MPAGMTETALAREALLVAECSWRSAKKKNMVRAALALMSARSNLATAKQRRANLRRK